MKYLLLPALVAGVSLGGGAHAAKISYGLTLDGKYASYRQDPEDYELPGFGLGGEAGLDDKGFSLNHSEISMLLESEYLTGRLTTVVEEDDGDLEAVLEEFYIQSVGLGNGITLRAGQFFSQVGYLNQQHAHSWDFADAPLVYRAMWGRQYLDRGVRVNWVAPTDMFMEFGFDALNGGQYPAGSHDWDGVDSQIIYANVGDDIDDSQSWLLGLSLYEAEVDDRQSGGHSHGGAGADEIPSFTGDSKALGLSVVYKWAPQGNFRNRNFKLQSELFVRKEGRRKYYPER